MIRPGSRNLITDVDGILVGNAEDLAARSGVTVVLPEAPVVAAADRRGGAPGTRETDLLDPSCLVERIDAVVLSGGSAFGLDAASGASSWLAARGRGYRVGAARVPVVPAAILFDLLNDGDKDWGADPPYRELGRAACDSAASDFALGNAGAGLGAKAGMLKGGLGSASVVTPDGVQVGALVAANPFGSVTMPNTPTLWAWSLELEGEFGGQPAPRPLTAAELDYTVAARLGGHTTLGVVATNLALDKARAQRLAVMAQDGLARAIRPVHTPFDGDIVFALSTGRLADMEATPALLARVGLLAADCLARAIGRAVVEARTLGDCPGYRSRYADALSLT